mgnify:CR=1 FL=1
MRAITIFISALMSLWSTSALAGSFTGQDVQNFIVALGNMQALEGEFDEVDLPAEISSEGNLQDLLDEDGSLSMFTRIGAALKGNKDVYSAMTGAVKDSGFSSFNDFSGKADSIMMTYIATQANAEELAQFKVMAANMPESMMPPGLKDQMASIQLLMSAIEQVPAEDVATLTPHLPALERAFD